MIPELPENIYKGKYYQKQLEALKEQGNPYNLKEFEFLMSLANFVYCTALFDTKKDNQGKFYLRTPVDERETMSKYMEKFPEAKRHLNVHMATEYDNLISSTPESNDSAGTIFDVRDKFEAVKASIATLTAPVQTK